MRRESRAGGRCNMGSLDSKKLLIAASGTGGHLFPAIAVARQLPDYQITWLGVPDRLEGQLVPEQYPLKTIAVAGFQGGWLRVLPVCWGLGRSIWQVRRLLKTQGFAGVFTTGGYIAAPAILAARSLGLPVILHESNAIPGKVTRWCGRFCTQVALGFAQAARHLPGIATTVVGTPVRPEFFAPCALELGIPAHVSLLVVVGGSQGAIAINRLVRQCAPQWLNQGIYIVHLTGDSDPEVKNFHHPHYLSLPFYHDMAALLQRADLAISRAGSGSLTELAITNTPAVLIPYPFAAEDHQTHNARIFAEVGAALLLDQKNLRAPELTELVLELLRSPARLTQMQKHMASLATQDSATQLAQLIRQVI